MRTSGVGSVYYPDRDVTVRFSWWYEEGRWCAPENSTEDDGDVRVLEVELPDGETLDYDEWIARASVDVESSELDVIQDLCWEAMRRQI